MLRFLPGPITAITALLLVALNSVLITLPLLMLTAVKLVAPRQKWRNACSRVLVRLAEIWIDNNSRLMRWLLRVDWRVTGMGNLQPDRSYLLICNHQSWLDIPVLQRTFNHSIPLLRFFLKQQLIWVPLLGAAWWALDFPFLQRHSQAALRKNPQLRGIDVAATRNACTRFRHTPVTMMNFLEGTRFTPRKHRRQGSPYRHLLKPKYGGAACVIGAMGERLHSLIDVTIRYPEGSVRLWDFACGRVSRVEVIVVERPLNQACIHMDCTDEAQARKAFRAWIDGIWLEKDRLLDAERPPNQA